MKKFSPFAFLATLVLGFVCGMSLRVSQAQNVESMGYKHEHEHSIAGANKAINDWLGKNSQKEIVAMAIDGKTVHFIVKGQ